MIPQLPIILYKHMPCNKKTFFKNMEVSLSLAADLEELNNRLIRSELKTYITNKKNTEFIDDFIPVEPLSSDPINLLKSIASQFANNFTKEALLSIRHKMGVAHNDCLEIKQYLAEIYNVLRNINILQLYENKFVKSFWERDLEAPFNPAHSGFMIGVDTRHDFFHETDDAGVLKNNILPVIYSHQDAIPYFSDCIIAQDIDEKIVFALIARDHEFKHEKEWRMLTPATIETISSITGHIEIPPKMVREVYLGARADEFLEAEAAEFCKKNNAKLFRMVLDGDDLIEPTPIPLS